MILYNPSHQDLFTDNFWVPTVMLEGPEPANTLLSFLERTRASSCHVEHRRRRRRIHADQMTTFSSRGPARRIHQAGRHGSRTPGARRRHARSGRRRVRAARAVVPVHRGYVHVQPVRRRRGGAHPGGPPELDPRSGEVGPHDVCAADRDEGGRRHARRPLRRRRRVDPRGSRRAADADVRCPRERFRRGGARSARLARPQPPEHRRDRRCREDLHDPLRPEREQIATNVHGERGRTRGRHDHRHVARLERRARRNVGDRQCEIVGQAVWRTASTSAASRSTRRRRPTRSTIPVAFTKTSGSIGRTDRSEPGRQAGPLGLVASACDLADELLSDRHPGGPRRWRDDPGGRAGRARRWRRAPATT